MKLKDHDIQAPSKGTKNSCLGRYFLFAIAASLDFSIRSLSRFWNISIEKYFNSNTAGSLGLRQLELSQYLVSINIVIILLHLLPLYVVSSSIPRISHSLANLKQEYTVFWEEAILYNFLAYPYGAPSKSSRLRINRT